jgi:hypothetical protein
MGASRDQSPQHCVACSTLFGARPRLPQFGRQPPRHGRQVDHGAGMVLSPFWTHCVRNAIVWVFRPATARAGPAIGTDPRPRCAAAASSAPTTGPTRSRPHRSENSDRRSWSGARQTPGWSPSVSRAADKAHATRRRAASAAGRRSAPIPRPHGWPHVRRDNQSPA